MAGPLELELDVAAIRAYCEQQSPAARARGRPRRCRARAPQSPLSSAGPRGGEASAQSGRAVPVARLRYVMRDNSWTVQWRDRNGSWHRYTDANPTADVTVLLNEIDEDPTGIFWG